VSSAVASSEVPPVFSRPHEHLYHDHIFSHSLAPETTIVGLIFFPRLILLSFSLTLREWIFFLAPWFFKLLLFSALTHMLPTDSWMTFFGIVLVHLIDQVERCDSDFSGHFIVYFPFDFFSFIS